MTLTPKSKAAFLCVLIFILGLASGFILKTILYKKAEYDFQYKFERLEPLGEALSLTDVQRALLFNILADHRERLDEIMKPVNPKINIQLHMMRENIKNILDEKQKAVYEKLIKDHEKRNSVLKARRKKARVLFFKKYFVTF